MERLCDAVVVRGTYKKEIRTINPIENIFGVTSTMKPHFLGFFLHFGLNLRCHATSNFEIKCHGASV